MEKKHFSYIKFFPIYLFNFVQSLHHHVLKEEIALIRDTRLFNQMNEVQFRDMLSSMRLVKYPADEIIFQEGDFPDALYIVVEGSVRVFTYENHNPKKIPLARLNKGDYFGEQAIIGQAGKTRNASIETITDTTVIRISAKKILPFWEKDKVLKSKLKEIGYKEAINSLITSIKPYKEIKSIFELQRTEKNKIIELPNDTKIFNLGDISDNVYFILQGKVKIELEENKVSILHKGHIFGELGVLENLPRKGTATTVDNVKLLVVPGSDFKAFCNENPQLQHLLAELKKTYQISSRGLVQQFIGSTPEVGTTITTIYKTDDGRNITAIRSLTEYLFIMSVEDYTDSTKTYPFQKDMQHFLELGVNHQHQLVMIKSYGEWDNLVTACEMLLDNVTIQDHQLQHFQSTGELYTKIISQEEMVCTCMSVSHSRLQVLINKGIRDIDSLAKVTGATTVCNACQPRIENMLGDNPWLTAVMKKVITHNPDIYSYIIEPVDRKFNLYKAGQHIIVQTKIHNTWIERCFTLSDFHHEKNANVRITIKKEPRGLFTTWLFDEASEVFDVNVTQPQGNFTLSSNTIIPALCFAGGVGITPFVAFAKQLLAEQSNKKLHIVYCTTKKDDVIFKDEFDEIRKQIPNVSVFFRDDMTNGLLTEKEIIHFVESMQDADIYICGPAGFEKMISKTLRDLNYNANKIHIEQFVHAGADK